MIKITQGNIIKAEAEALVNTVNTVGLMGKGIALQFKRAFPENFKAYECACKNKILVPGKVFVFESGEMFNPKFIINFPTKRHWRGKSLMSDIERGLESLVEEVRSRKIKSIAIPPLGCGLGGLNWSEVRPIIERAFKNEVNVKVLLFEPKGSPPPSDMPVNTEKPKWTLARALLIKLMDRYSELSYRLTLLEVQKLAYFLQEAGEPMNLKYTKAQYGPYADNLNKVLERINGHFVTGLGDSQTPNEELEVVNGIDQEAFKFIKQDDKSLSRLRRVFTLVEGFETPYGLELLSSVHWVAEKDEVKASSADEAMKFIWAWNDRKKKMFKKEHISIAWQTLEENGWIN